MRNSRTDSQIFDLLALGLTWVQETVEASNGWTGNGVLGTFHQMGGISDEQYRFIARQPPQSLKDYAVARLYLFWPRNGKVSRRGLHSVLRDSDKLMVTFIDSVMFASDRLFVPRGYNLQMTDRGRKHAHQVAGRYGQELSHERFLAQWKTHRRYMASMYARYRDA